VTAAQVLGDIERLIAALFAAGIAIDSNKTVALSSHKTTIITWSNDISLSSLFEMSSLFEQYMETLRKRWYSVILFDGSLLQLSYTFAGTVLKKHRLSFQPCPIYIKPEELGFFSIQELLDVVEGQEFRDRVRLEGPLRFDYDLDAGHAHHPPSHLTLSRSSCRVPVSAPLSVGHFVRFLFSHFYPEQWAANEVLRSWGCDAWTNCLPDLEDDQLFVSWHRRGSGQGRTPIV
jgi:hypothetical protein